MTGHTVKTPELVAEAHRLRVEGKTFREVGETLGVSFRTAHNWVTDPTGAKMAARKAGYRGACVDCGAPTNGNAGPGKACLRCRPCAAAWLRDTYGVWNRERIIVAIQTWAEESGGVPPSATDWNPALARAYGHPEKAERYEADEAWPSAGTVQYHFGTWNAAIRAAGFEPRRRGSYGRDGEDPAVVAKTVALYRSGLTLTAVGVEMGVSASAVRDRLVAAGEPRRSPSESARLSGELVA